MKKKLLLSAFIAALFSLPFILCDKAHAFKIKDDGQYALVMNLKNSDEGATIDGSNGKILKFDFDDENEKVKLFDLTKGIVAFNGKNEFSGWALSSSDSEPASGDMELSSKDFISEGKFGETSYTKGKIIYALFTGKEITQVDTYRLLLDCFGGKINDKDKVTLESKEDEFQTIDLSKYTPKRDDCEFCGWGYDSKIVTSIDKSYFSKEHDITVFALYKSNKFYGVDENGKLNNTDLPEKDRPNSYVLILNANGGTIDGETSKKYDYLTNPGNSDASMPIFHYIPERKGYTFKGWNTKKDGSGKNYEYMDWSSWRSTSDVSEFEKDSLIENGSVYANLTLYATWEGGSEPKDEETTVKETSDTSEVKGSITFESPIDENYTLDIKKVEIPKELEDQNVKFIVDINLLNPNLEIVEINGQKMKIKIALPEELKGYKNYKVVYIKDGEIKETLPATVEDGNIIFETSHLSQYGIIATNEEGNELGEEEIESGEEKPEVKEEKEEKEKTEETQESEEDSKNPITGDTIALAVTLFALVSCGVAASPIIRKKNSK